mmetsp:Transcript_80843/g.228839  ORF Transcript_80843/g.228839 Transcript_80843/m.228839 type:complete len:401 (+) Transcript_80843:125-1327(+)
MGIPSPFVGAATSPVLPRSKQATPEPRLLSTMDEFAGVEVLDLCPPRLGLLEEKVYSSWEQVETGAIDDEGITATPPSEPSGLRGLVPEWPEHLPDYMHEVTELNTFLELPAAAPGWDLAAPRRRAASDWSGIRAIEELGAAPASEEELRRPLPEPRSAQPELADADARWLQSSQMQGMAQGVFVPAAGCDQGAEQQWYWQAGAEQGGVAWVVVCEDTPRPWPTEAQEGVPQLPPPAAEGQEAYRPKWVYGPSWPFNHAPTALVLDNVPRDLTQAELLAVMDNAGFSGFYDFVFLPAIFRTGRNQGQAIINFTRHCYGLDFAARAHGFSGWGCGDDGRPCEAKWSLPLQGLVELVENYRNHPAMHESVPEGFRPMLFSEGWQVPFPLPTRRIRPPRMGHW